MFRFRIRFFFYYFFYLSFRSYFSVRLVSLGHVCFFLLGALLPSVSLRHLCFVSFQNPFFYLSFRSYFSVRLVSLCSRTRYVSISLALPINLRLFCFGFSLFHSLWPQNLYLSRIRNQETHWVYWCGWVERTGLMWRQHTHIGRRENNRTKMMK